MFEKITWIKKDFVKHLFETHIYKMYYLFVRCVLIGYVPGMLLAIFHTCNN